MKMCELCRLPLKMSSQGTMHPMCADRAQFHRQHGGWPLFLSSREGCRSMGRDIQGGIVTHYLPGGDPLSRGTTRVRVVDAGKGKTHPESLKIIPGGTRWALVVTPSTQ